MKERIHEYERKKSIMKYLITQKLMINLRYFLYQIKNHPFLLIMLFCIMIRLVYFTHLQPYTVSADTNSYVNAMNTILQGKVDKLRPPLYPLLLGIMRAIFGTNYMLATVNFQTLFSLLSIVFFYMTCKKMLKNKNTIYCATILYGILPQITSWERVLIPESIAISGTIMFFYLITRYLDRPTNKKACFIGILCFLFVMLKPAFIIYAPIILIFWILRFLTQRKEFVQNTIGIIVIVAIFLLLRGYCYLNERDNGYDGISIVGSNLNQVFMLMDNNMYENPAYPDIVNKIKVLKTNSPYTITWDQMMALNAEVDSQLLTEYASSTIQHNIHGYLYYSIKKFVLLAKEPISVDKYANPIDTHWEVISDSAMYFLFPFTFLHIYLLILAEFIVSLRHFVKDRSIPWVTLGLVVFLAAQLVVAVIGAMSDWQRLVVNVFPFILTLFFLDAERMIGLVQSRSIQEQVKTV